MRGNLNTRLNKLTSAKDYAGLILAAAGVHRMGWNDKISQVRYSLANRYIVSNFIDELSSKAEQKHLKYQPISPVFVYHVVMVNKSYSFF